MHPLDNPAWAALTTAHRAFAIGDGAARRYPTEVSPISAIGNLDDDAWRDLQALANPALIIRAGVEPLPETAKALHRGTLHQYLAPTSLTPRAVQPDGRVQLRALTEADVSSMIELVERTKPGPFASRTIEFGGYMGLVDGDRLLAMAGCRLHLDGYCEISAVCTDASSRGRGYGGYLTELIAMQIRDRGEQPFLHVMASNGGAIRLYEQLGFVRRAVLDFALIGFPVAPG